MTSYKKKKQKILKALKPASNINKNRNQEKRKKKEKGKKGKKELCKYLLILVLKNTISRETRMKNEATIK